MDNYDSDNRMWDENKIYDYAADTLKAFADAIIPRSPGLAEQYGRVQYYGALDLYTAEYLIMSLGSLAVPSAIPAAEILNVAAEQFLYGKGDNRGPFSSDRKFFLNLTPAERFQVIDLLLQPEGIAYFPALMQMEPEYVISVISSLNRLIMMGYYSEWPGYGSTRLFPPDQRILEHYPVSWEQIGYPGPSLGYRVSKSYSYT